MTTEQHARGRVTVERSAKRVRTYLHGEAIADTTHALLVWEVPYYPAYYVPVADVRMDLLVPSDTVTHSPSRGDARHFSVKVGDDTQRVGDQLSITAFHGFLNVELDRLRRIEEFGGVVRRRVRTCFPSIFRRAPWLFQYPWIAHFLVPPHSSSMTSFPRLP